MPLPDLVRNASERNPRAKRIADFSHRLIVQSRTLGTLLSYSMETDNLSRTGLLINVARYKRVPFALNTLLEMTIDPAGSVFESPVSCFGKIVRLDDETSKARRYGIQIIHMDSREQATWERYVATLEKSAAA